MVALNKFNVFTKDLVDGKHNFASNTFKLLLTNVAPVVGNTVKANLTEIAAGGGYTAGGITLSVSTATAGGVAKVVVADANLECVEDSNGGIATWRYGVIYNDTAAGDPLIAWFDHGSAVTMVDTDTHAFDFNDTDGILSV